MTASGTVLAGTGAAQGAPTISVGPISTVSSPCTGQNAEVEQAVDPSGPGYVYEAWTGCAGIGLSRSTDDGTTFTAAVTLPGSTFSPGDPDLAVAPDGTVYVVFMMENAEGQNYPVVDASTDHGATFPQVTTLLPPGPLNWGDSPNIAVGQNGDVYVTWDYGPSSAVIEHCHPMGSCSFSGGDTNVVIQTSTDGGATFGPIVPISRAYPWSGADNAPLVIDPSGRLDVLYQAYAINPTTHLFGPAVNYFTASGDNGATWSTPVSVRPRAGTMSLPEWWNEPSLAIDAGGNLYAAWDTQGRTATGQKTDTGWLSYSVDGGATWSMAAQAPADVRNVPHIMEVAGGAAGEAEVGWLSDSNPLGYALYLRPFSIAGGWLTKARQVSTLYGDRAVWPGDTFGLSALDSTHVATSWGGAVPGSGGKSRIFAAVVTVAQSGSNTPDSGPRDGTRPTLNPGR
ncbi:MAG: sialidase family protein [Acidimicrobiales bacterium]